MTNDVSVSAVPKQDTAQSKGLKGTTFSAVDLMAMKVAEPKWAVHGIIPEGFTILAGNPKYGKSWMALNLSVAVAPGGLAFGEIPVERGDVHYLALEDNKRRLQERLMNVLGGNDAPKRLTLSIGWPRLDSEGKGLERLDQWLADHPEARLIIVDTFKKIRPLRKSRGDIYSEDYDHADLLKRLADKYSVAIVGIHHTNKAVHDEDWLEGISGSFGLTGAIDTALLLRRARGQHDAVLHVTGRDLQEQDIGLKWHSDTYTWQMLGNADISGLSEDRATVVKILQEQGQPMSPKEMASLLKKTEENTRQLLSRMVKSEQIKSTGYGKYTTVSHSSHSSHSSVDSPTDKESAGKVSAGHGEENYNSEWV